MYCIIERRKNYNLLRQIHAIQISLTSCKYHIVIRVDMNIEDVREFEKKMQEETNEKVNLESKYNYIIHYLFYLSRLR